MTGLPMSIFGLFKNIKPFVRPYHWLVVITLVLTLLRGREEAVT